MNRKAAGAGLLGLMALAVFMYQLKAQIIDRATRVRALEIEMVEEEKALRVLEAEWAYLSSPEELQKRSVKYLGLGPMEGGQIVASLDQLPFRELNDIAPAAGPSLAGAAQPAPLGKEPLSPRATPRLAPTFEAKVEQAKYTGGAQVQ